MTKSFHSQLLQDLTEEFRRIGYAFTDLLSTISTPQRSETMNTVTAMQKAKEQPGVNIVLKHATIVYEKETKVSYGRWHLTKNNGENNVESLILGDTEGWEPEQSEIQEGDWVRVINSTPSNTNEYAQVTGGDEVNGLSVHFMGTDQGFLGNSGTFFAKNVEKITDERTVMFLNHGREPNTFKPGDIVQFQKIGVEILNFHFRDKNNELKLICFIEDRKDRGGSS